MPAASRRGHIIRIAGLLGLLTALALVVLASVGYGSVTIGWRTVIEAFSAFNGSNEHLIVRQLRVPRTVVGVSAGAALALAGALMQGMTRNPLADPGILGINAGAALGVVLAIFLFGFKSVSFYVWFAFLGAAAGAIVVYIMSATGREGPTPVKLSLSGAAVAAFCAAATSAILVLNARSLDQFRFWAVGSLVGRDLGVVRTVAPFMALGGIIALSAGRSLNTLSLGEDTARSLGHRIRLVRSLMLLAVVLLAGSAVAVAGPIAFAGLAVPQAARLLVGPDWRWILGYSVVLGPSLLLGADILGRFLAQPGEVEVGIMTALIGAPMFLYLVRRGRIAER